MKLINSYKNNFASRFEKKRKEIEKALPNCEIHHIGSTAVAGLGGKGIIDIMVGIKNWGESQGIVEKLKEVGFEHIHPKEDERIFLSTTKESKIGDFHIHLVLKNSKNYKELLFFRDYLRQNKSEAKKHFNFKKQWAKECSNDRKKYAKVKGKFIKDILIKNGEN